MSLLKLALKNEALGIALIWGYNTTAPEVPETETLLYMVLQQSASIQGLTHTILACGYRTPEWARIRGKGF
jgi:hypothetical protein